MSRNLRTTLVSCIPSQFTKWCQLEIQLILKMLFELFFRTVKRLKESALLIGKEKESCQWAMSQQRTEGTICVKPNWLMQENNTWFYIELLWMSVSMYILIAELPLISALREILSDLKRSDSSLSWFSWMLAGSQACL